MTEQYIGAHSARNPTIRDVPWNVGLRAEWKSRQLRTIRGRANPTCPIDDRSPLVAEASAFALGELGDPRAVPRVVHHAGGNRDALVREACVAALGAIGVRDALPTLLTAMHDKPAIRRRAVIALSAFEGPDVDAALHEALTDRDWQVRQLAEDLTD